MSAVTWRLSSARSSQNVNQWQIDKGFTSQAYNDYFNTFCYCAITPDGTIEFYDAENGNIGGSLVV